MDTTLQTNNLTGVITGRDFAYSHVGFELKLKKNLTIASTPTRNNAGLFLAKLIARAGEASRWTNKIIMKDIIITALITLLLMATMPAFAEKSKSINADSYTISLGDGISLQMTVAPFDAKKHKIKKCQLLDWSGVCLIDGKPVFGTDWELPKNQLIKASVKIGQQTINLDVSCMFNPFFGKPDPQNFTIETVEGGYLVRGSFSDGAGSYEAEWLIIDNSSIRTKLQNKEC